MVERNPRSVEEIPFQRRQQFVVDTFLARRAVNRVAHHGTSERGEVYSDLMRSAGVQVGFNKGKVAEPQAQPPVGASLASFPAPRRHARTAAKISRDRQLNSSGFAFQLPVQQRNICFFDAAFAKILDKS